MISTHTHTLPSFDRHLGRYVSSGRVESVRCYMQHFVQRQNAKETGLRPVFFLGMMPYSLTDGYQDTMICSLTDGC